MASLTSCESRGRPSHQDDLSLLSLTSPSKVRITLHSIYVGSILLSRHVVNKRGSQPLKGSVPYYTESGSNIFRKSHDLHISSSVPLSLSSQSWQSDRLYSQSYCPPTYKRGWSLSAKPHPLPPHWTLNRLPRQPLSTSSSRLSLPSSALSLCLSVHLCVCNHAALHSNALCTFAL